MVKSGASIVVNCLLEQKVDTVFGYPGVSILAVYDELYKHRGAIRHILSAHEQGAAHAADGYARTMGRPGVCLATSGPGATNLVTGIAAAFMDSSPVIFITCNVDSELLGRDAFQEVDIVGISMPITKCSYLVDNPAEIAPTMREAFAVATSGRPGPVLIDITHNATVEKADYEFVPKDAQAKQLAATAAYRRGGMALRRGNSCPDGIERLARLVAAAKRPLLLAGGGVLRAGAAGLLKSFAEERGIPLASTLMGSGIMCADNMLYCGMAGSYGTSAANYALQSCDLLLAIGVRFSDRLTGKIESFAPKAEIAQIDIDRAEIDKNVCTCHHVIGDAAEIIKQLEEICHAPAVEKEWIRELGRLKLLPERAVFPEQLIRALCRRCPEAIITTDVGQHQIWACRNFDFAYPGQLVTSGGYGAMGFGLGAALGAKAGCPEKEVIHITGDGSFGMNLTELATEKREKLPVITIVFNNSSLGLVRQNQRMNYGHRYSQTALEKTVDYCSLASAFGLPSERIDNLPAFESALERFLAGGNGGIIECVIDRDEFIAPMLDKGRLIY